MRFLTVEELSEINEVLLGVTGGLAGVVDPAALEDAANRPQALVGNYEPFPNLFSKAAALCHTLAERKPFANANGATGFLAADLFLRLNGYRLTSHDTDADHVYSLSKLQLTIPQIATWLEEKAEPFPVEG